MKPTSPTCARCSACHPRPDVFALPQRRPRKRHAQDHPRPAQPHRRRHRRQRAADDRRRPAGGTGRRRPRGIHRTGAVRLLPRRHAGGVRIHGTRGCGHRRTAGRFARHARAALGGGHAHARPGPRQAPAQQPARAAGRRGPPHLCQAAAAHLQHLRRTPPLRARTRRRAGAAHRPRADRLPRLRGWLERHRGRLRHQPLPAPGRCRAGPGGEHQRESQPHRQARGAAPGLRRRRAAPRPAGGLREPSRRPGPDRL